jgi:hypothetical protein
MKIYFLIAAGISNFNALLKILTFPKYQLWKDRNINLNAKIKFN